MTIPWPQLHLLSCHSLRFSVFPHTLLARRLHTVVMLATLRPCSSYLSRLMACSFRAITGTHHRNALAQGPPTATSLCMPTTKPQSDIYFHPIARPHSKFHSRTTVKVRASKLSISERREGLPYLRRRSSGCRMLDGYALSEDDGQYDDLKR